MLRSQECDTVRGSEFQRKLEGQRLGGERGLGAAGAGVEGGGSEVRKVTGVLC